MLASIEKTLNSINEPVAKLGSAISGTFLIFMSIIVIAQVFFRYVFGAPLDWTDEASRFLMIYMTYLALPAVYLADKNIAMTLFLDKVKGKRGGHLLMFFIHLLSIAAFALWIKAGMTFFESGSVRADSLPIPMYVVYFIPPFMFAITCLSALQKAVSELAQFVAFQPDAEAALSAN